MGKGSGLACKTIKKIKIIKKRARYRGTLVWCPGKLYSMGTYTPEFTVYRIAEKFRGGTFL